jgi:hypothetical protein
MVLGFPTVLIKEHLMNDSQEVFPFGLSDKGKLKNHEDRSIFNPDGTPFLVDFGPTVLKSGPVVPTQPVVAPDPKAESAPAPVYSKEDTTPETSSSETPSEETKTPVQPGATGGTTKSKGTGTSKPTS